MVTIELVKKFLPYVDEQFTTESKKAMLTNQDFDWNGANSVKIYKISTGAMNDYSRFGGRDRYGVIESLNATTQEMALTRDRSFTFAIDTLDADETAMTLKAATALARQLREVVIPEVDTYTYGVMAAGAGTKPAALTLTAENIYTEIIKANNTLDNAQVPENNRYLVVTPDVYMLMKQCKDIVMETNIGNDLRLKGVVSNLDGVTVLKIPANRLPEGFGFMLVHPSATVAPTKLAAYNTHMNPPGISGQLVEGRICYDAFVMENKAKAIYYQAQEVATE